MRPKSVIHAERLYLLATALLIFGTLLVWRPLVSLYGVRLAGGISALIVGAFILLTLFATRRGSRVARALLVALTAFGALSLLWQIATDTAVPGIAGAVNAVQVVLTVLGAVLLFRPSAGVFFARPHDDWEEDA